MNMQQPRRTAGIWWLCALTTALALFQGAAAWRALGLPPALAAAVSLPGALGFAAAGLWALLFALLTVNLWQLRPNALRYTAAALSAFVLYSAARLALYARADYDRQRLPFALLAALLCCAVPALWLLRRPSNRHVNGDA
ncbi:MAG: hypothetical protein ACUVSX_01465 [Aggregatilineales bacterium]